MVFDVECDDIWQTDSQECEFKSVDLELLVKRKKKKEKHNSAIMSALNVGQQT